MRDCSAIIEQAIEQDKQELFHVITGNPEIVMASQKDEQLRTIIQQAGLVTADGIGVVMVSRLRRQRLPERVTGCDLLLELLAAGNRNRWSVYLLGADEETNRGAAEAILKMYPHIRVAGRHHGYFKPEEDGRIVQEIATAQPDILAVALGAPNAERWIHKYRSQLHAKVAMGVGGTLDVIAGTVPRAPMIWRRMNLEWLYRLIHQPSRWRRQLMLPRFAVRALLHRERENIT
ncbi:WecB/TagA/CpsF family glycosyltransferase [Paenibacillus lacisoli]|nr:WecB/TagA/CpsF family glycosyltransferase [Paenibacillus sp. JX-17]